MTTDEDQTCPSCEKIGVKWREDVRNIYYGLGEEAVRLEVDVPVGACTACGFEFVGWAGQAKTHDAVCRHLGALTPSEMRRLSQTQLALELGVRVGSVGSWERGGSIQSVENDALLRKMRIDEMRAAFLDSPMLAVIEAAQKRQQGRLLTLLRMRAEKTEGRLG